MIYSAVIKDADEDATCRLAAALAPHCVAGDCVLLEGELGTGKTVFARGFIQALCGEETEVVSPTFTLMQNYQTRDGLALTHFDLYRLKDPRELDELGLEDTTAQGITLIEWPQIALNRLPDEALSVSFTMASPETRNITLQADEETAWPALLKKLL